MDKSNTMSNIEITGLGALNIDHLYKVERILDDGEAVVNETKSSPGGSAANTIYGLAKLGVSTGFTGVVGDDAEGKILMQDFQKAGVDTPQIRVKPGAKTGSVICLSDRLGRRSLYITPGANNLLTMDDLDLTYINQARMLHLSSFADDRQFKILLELMHRLDLSTKLSFAPGALYASKGLKALAPILTKTHILFINRDEIKQLTGEDITNGAENCLKQGCSIIVVTLGKGIRLELGKGTSHRTVTAIGYIRDTETEHAIQSSNQDIVSQADTTGAGDAFATGFLYGLLKGKGLKECGRLGDIVARFSITKLGTRQGFPTLNQLAQRYQELYSEQL
ncbi:MAG: carbohydrate kinase family protein [Dehalococcoidia bacterium]|nr:MAG: carbohydrate kinase family protein [Dehalococcoidia bacterium]